MAPSSDRKKLEERRMTGPSSITIVTSEDGGPIRRINNGRGHAPRGSEPSLKASGWGMPWESVQAELSTIDLAEVGSPIIRVLAQPHRLELPVVGLRRPLIYFPDLHLTVEDSFLRSLGQKPFGRAIIEWKPDRDRPLPPRTLIVEVKDDGDRRKDDPFYREKLRLARETYALMGYVFVEILRSRDIDCVNLRNVREILLDKSTVVSALDVGRAVRHLRSVGSSGTLAGLIDALGGGSNGKATASALHVRRIVSIDLSQPLCGSSPVYLVRPFEAGGCSDTQN